MTRTGKRKSSRSTRKKLQSPGRPPVLAKSARRPFWEAIARGLTSEDAALVAGVSPPVGTRWFRHCGGMPPSHSWTSGSRAIGALSRAPRAGRTRALACARRWRARDFAYRATTAQWHADRATLRPKVARLATGTRLRAYVTERLAGLVVTSTGAALAGPQVAWKGRRQRCRQARRWARAWSPEHCAAFATRLPDDPTMHISHEAIYQALYVQGRGAPRRELTACLRTGRATRPTGPDRRTWQELRDTRRADQRATTRD